MSPRAQSEHHLVTVTTATEDDWAYLESIEFTCTAPENADCRTYPDCGCETFTEGDQAAHDAAGHPYVPGRECWVKTWFDASPGAECTIYVGGDGTYDTDCGVPLVERSGHVEVVGFDVAPEWRWAS